MLFEFLSLRTVSSRGWASNSSTSTCRYILRGRYIIEPLIDRSIDWSIDWLNARLIDRSIADWLTDLHTDWLTDWLINRLVDWVYISVLMIVPRNWEVVIKSETQREPELFDVKYYSFIHSFIHSDHFYQVHFYSEALPTQLGYCAGVSRRSLFFMFLY